MASLSINLITLPIFLYIFLQCSLALLDQQSNVTPSPDVDMADCGTRLLPLAQCAPFIQGSVSLPPQSCCHNLIELYDLQPICLCILLNESPVTTFPINRTLALKLPAICKLEASTSSCPGLVLTPGSPESNIFNGSNANTSSLGVSSSALAPKMNLGVGLGRSASTKLKFEAPMLAHAITASLLMQVLYLFK
ncbi:hypothetical protein IFM89_024333 [Coptis chinensis]|uniref:Bifunctional inhibitor/plant lipid transfer protein/seed storage helical domain-containing protein n=1 Tax=Coptis chinensis TaxID=261450 RepID=A0A835IXE3_9MAGN|nr:hypothetical protein IFM89_024333 [Coptis chinensis]